MLFISILLLSALLVCVIAYTTALPRHFPRNIPVVPIWLQTYDLLRGASRIELYNARIRGLIEKHGAVALWHEGHWSVLVSRPEYLLQVFKNSGRTLQKKGFFERIPWGTAATIFGINIIDSDGELYAQFRKLLKPGFSMQLPIPFIKKQTARLAEQLCQRQESEGYGNGVRIGPLVWRWALSVWGDYFLDAQFGPLDYSQYNIQQILALQTNTLLGRAKNVFPLLDRLPWRLPITQHTIKLLHQVEIALRDVAETRSKLPAPPGGENKVGFLLHQARQQNSISDFHYVSNLNQLFIAGHENVETVVNSAMEELANHARIQHLLHAEVTQLLPTDYSIADLDKLPLLNAVIYETIRLYPPLGQLVNRLTTEPFQLGPDILIPPGIMLGWHAYGVQTDPRVWGESARQFDPFRWGTDSASVKQTLRNRQARGQYIPFGMYARKCMGYTFALQLLQCTICELARNLEWKHPPGYKFSYSQVGLHFQFSKTGYYHRLKRV
jgi:unspecific monooxygenase